MRQFSIELHAGMVLWRFVFGFFLLFSFSSFGATNGIQEVNLRLNDLAYDPVTKKLYATSPDHLNDLLQLDPATGAIVATFPVGNTPHRLVLDTRRGLWIGLNGEGAVRRFDLDTLTAEPKFNLQVGSNAIFDIAPSSNDTDTFAVNTAGRTYLVRDGVLLPDSIQQVGYLVMVGNYVFGQVRMRITPTGLVVDGAGVSSGDTDVVDGRIYFAGSSLDPFAPQTQLWYYPPFPGVEGFPPQAASFEFAVNGDDSSYLLLSHYINRFHLTRFNRATAEVTGYAQFDVPPPVNWTFQFAAVGTNRVAMGTSEKLYFLDLSTLFAPGDLQLSVTVEPNPAPLGRFVTETITVVNAGPGYIVDTVLTNNLAGDAGFVSASPGPVFSFGTLGPGESRTLKIEATPLAAGTFTSTVTAASKLETNAQNNTVQVNVPVLNTLSNVITRLAPSPTNITALAYDPARDKLTGGDARGWLFELGLDNAEVKIGPFSYDIQQIAVSPGNPTNWVAVGGWNSIYSVVLDTGATSREYRIGAAARDLEVSPVDSLVVAHSTPSHVGILFQGNPLNGGGLIEFSGDGTKLYQILDVDCSLRVLNLTATNLTVERTYPNMPCYDFTESSGRLYFNNGAVVDPSNGTTVTNLNLPFPSFVVPDPSGPLDVLTRVEKNWVIRRLDRNTFQEISTIHLGAQFSPTIAISAGTNRIAFIDRSGEAILVRFEADASNMLLTVLRTASGATLQFPTAAGVRYRLEESPAVVNPTWTPVSEEFTGTGLLTERTVPASGQSSFYRLVRLP